MRLPMEASAVNNSYGQGFRKTRAHQAPDRRVPERCRSRVALPRAHTLPLLIEARGEPTSACKRFFGAILRANAKDRDFPCRSAAAVRCRFPPTGGLFFRSRPIGKSPTSALKRRCCRCEAFCYRQVAPSPARSFAIARQSTSTLRRVNPPARDAPTSTTWPAKALRKNFENFSPSNVPLLIVVRCDPAGACKRIFRGAIGKFSTSSRSRATGRRDTLRHRLLGRPRDLEKISLFFSGRTETEIDSQQGNPAGPTRSDIDYLAGHGT